MKLLKDKARGGYLLLASAAIALIAAVLYAIFGISSGTFMVGILVCLLLAVICGGAALAKETVFSDFLSIAMTVILSIALGLFVQNSVGDFTEVITPVGMYGNPDNMPMRYVILAFILVSIVVSIVEGFAKRVKAN